jgi:hypothetical protein
MHGVNQLGLCGKENEHHIDGKRTNLAQDTHICPNLYFFFVLVRWDLEIVRFPVK